MHRKGFSLASLLLLTAVAAVFLAGICTAWLPPDRGRFGPEGYDVEVDADFDPGLVSLCVMGGLLLGSFVGLVIGVGQVRPVPGVFLATLVGGLFGAATGGLLAVPDKTLPITVGALLIVLFGTVVRRFSRGPPK